MTEADEREVREDNSLGRLLALSCRHGGSDRAVGKGRRLRGKGRAPQIGSIRPMCAARLRSIMGCTMLMTGSEQVDADRAFSQMARRRRRAEIARRLRREPAVCGQLEVYDERVVRRGGVGPARGIRPIPIDAIRGTVEPSRAAQFDRDFRPAPIARTRWERVWLAEHRGAALPPVSVVPVEDGYALRDGHHRVSVARARGALAIDATIDATL